MRRRKHWIQLGSQIVKLYFQKKKNQQNLISQSYNKISHLYDEESFSNMNKFSKEMIDKIKFPKDGKAIDLTCGTGYVTHLISKHFKGEIIGIDISNEMIRIAQERYGDTCQFVCMDALDFLRQQPSESIDIVTCVWGLGFLPPKTTIKEISRVLKPGGQLAIMDNSLFTLYEVVISVVSTLAEYPAALIGMLNGNWVSTKGALKRKMRGSGLKVLSSWKGEITYYARNEKDAVDFLINTGSIIGYQYCLDTQYYRIIRERFGEIFTKSYGTKQGLPITHRFIASIAKKPK